MRAERKSPDTDDVAKVGQPDSGKGSQAPSSHPKEPRYVHIFGSVAGAVVVIGSVIVVFAMMGILYLQILKIEGATSVQALDRIVEIAKENQVDFSEQDSLDIVGRIALETDAQYLRTARAQSLTGSRLTIQIIAELISLSLVVIGGALIFARIRSGREADQIGATANDHGSLDLRTTFPGLVLCAFGAATVAWALYISIDPNFRGDTLDGPIYIDGVGTAGASRATGATANLKELCERTGFKSPRCEEFKE